MRKMDTTENREAYTARKRREATLLMCGPRRDRPHNETNPCQITRGDIVVIAKGTRAAQHVGEGWLVKSGPIMTGAGIAVKLEGLRSLVLVNDLYKVDFGGDYHET